MHVFYHFQQGEAKKALAVLRKPSVSPELQVCLNSLYDHFISSWCMPWSDYSVSLSMLSSCQMFDCAQGKICIVLARESYLLRLPLISDKSVQYKFAPALIMLDPHETVDAWTSTGLNLNPRQLIPALMRYSSERRPRYAPFLICRWCDEEFFFHLLNSMVWLDLHIWQLSMDSIFFDL